MFFFRLSLTEIYYSLFLFGVFKYVFCRYQWFLFSVQPHTCLPLALTPQCIFHTSHNYNTLEKIVIKQWSNNWNSFEIGSMRSVKKYCFSLAQNAGKQKSSSGGTSSTQWYHYASNIERWAEHQLTVNNVLIKTRTCVLIIHRVKIKFDIFWSPKLYSFCGPNNL